MSLLQRSSRSIAVGGAFGNVKSFCWGNTFKKYLKKQALETKRTAAAPMGLGYGRLSTHRSVGHRHHRLHGFYCVNWVRGWHIQIRQKIQGGGATAGADVGCWVYWPMWPMLAFAPFRATGIVPPRSTDWNCWGGSAAAIWWAGQGMRQRGTVNVFSKSRLGVGGWGGGGGAKLKTGTLAAAR